jgi:tocopherol cyclase
MYRLQRLWRAGIFQGVGRKDNYFEGWYFKLVDAKLENMFAVIPGVSLKDHGSHAFIQLLDGKQAESSYFNFNMEDFSYRKDRFRISIGKNIFSDGRMRLAIKRKDISLKADIMFKNNKGWPGKLISPGAMGWYSFVPFMECYHGVISMDHDLEGSLEINGNIIDLDGGKGYIEKDWGSSFPQGWIWLQSNNFDKDDPCSLMLSIAKIPWRGRSFTGFICGLLHKDDFYIMATYNGAVIENIHNQRDCGRIKIIISRRDLRLEVDARKNKSGKLASPIMGAMEGRINEGLDSVIRVDLFRKDKAIVSDTGRCGGLEMVNTELLDC